MREIAVLAEAAVARAREITVFAEAPGGPAKAERASVRETAVFAKALVASVREIAVFAEALVARAPETPSAAKLPLEHKFVYRYIHVGVAVGHCVFRLSIIDGSFMIFVSRMHDYSLPELSLGSRLAI